MLLPTRLNRVSKGILLRRLWGSDAVGGDGIKPAQPMRTQVAAAQKCDWMNVTDVHLYGCVNKGRACAGRAKTAHYGHGASLLTGAGAAGTMPSYLAPRSTGFGSRRGRGWPRRRSRVRAAGWPGRRRGPVRRGRGRPSSHGRASGPRKAVEVVAGRRGWRGRSAPRPRPRAATSRPRMRTSGWRSTSRRPSVSVGLEADDQDRVARVVDVVLEVVQDAAGLAHAAGRDDDARSAAVVQRACSRRTAAT